MGVANVLNAHSILGSQMALSPIGKTAIITGAGSGINLSFANNLLSKRCNVLFADLALRPEAQELVSNHTNSCESPARAVFQQTEVRDWQHLERMFQVASREFGGADIVCPGAGVFEPLFSSFWHPPGMHPSTDSPTSNRYASLDINLIHPIRTTQLALAQFLSTKSKHHTKPSPRAIIHISSVAGQLTPVAAPIYNVTKHGISAFVRSLAPLDKQLGVRVTAVAPGVIKTPLWTDNPDKLRLIADEDQWATPEFVAEVMASLVEQPVVEVDAGGMGSAQPTRADDAREGTRKVPVEGGMILEVAKAKVRVVGQFNDPGPSGEGIKVGNRSIADDEVFEARGSGKWGVV